MPKVKQPKPTPDFRKLFQLAEHYWEASRLLAEQAKGERPQYPNKNLHGHAPNSRAVNWWRRDLNLNVSQNTRNCTTIQDIGAAAINCGRHAARAKAGCRECCWFWLASN